ncbi:MAG TPA: 3-hydroxyacyl-CoA dehydrogenase NAD-binding domain-containing protein [Chthoniobacterales bacterium]|jgi:3-hydroxyacyl-CoA dehydrogenase/enoyl-CoA hydratase/3-hydroxybutyryl-CoA epimerase
MSAMISTSPMIRREIGDDGICVLIFDRPDSGANIFDAATMNDLSDHLGFIEKEKSLKGVIIASAKKSIFIAGADLQTLLEQAQTGELRAFIAEGQRVFNRLAALKIPTAAAIHGACAGGGYEITLACDYRVASNDPATRIGLPETTLGLIPAWGGATRLPRLIGAAAAANVILKGKLHSAEEALKAGLIDEIVPREQLMEAARRKIRERKRKPSAPPGAEKEIATPVDHNPAPARALDVIKRGLTSSVDESLALELDAIVELGESEATQNLIRNFFLGDKFRKGTSKTPAEKISHAAVIGAGVMGSGIAQWLSSRGVSVILRDVNAEQLDRGLANIEKTYSEAVKRGLMTEDKAKEGRARIVASAVSGELRDVQIVIEAASEKLEIKKQIFRDLVAKTPAKTILATNTSALSISDLGATAGEPGRVIGLHFFNPVSRMKLVEVVVGKETAPETVERALAFTRQIGKLPVVVRDSPGFLVNRVLFPYLLDAAELYECQIGAKEIDDTLVEWGMPMGPLRLIDEIGIDITVDIAETLAASMGSRARMPQILQKMRAAQMLGRKSGAGFYKYEGKQQTENEAPKQWRLECGENFAAENLRNRLIFLMVNEAARCLEEKVVSMPEDADFGMMMGTGFAPFRGGPLRFADHFGLKKLVTEMDGLHARAGDKFVPCDLLRQHAQDGTTFYGK